MKKFRIMKKRCDQCLFSEAKIVSNERKKEIIEGCEASGNYFVCHKSQDVCCRGFFDAQLTQNVQVLGRLHDMGYASYIEWVDYSKPEEQEI